MKSRSVKSSILILLGPWLVITIALANRASSTQASTAALQPPPNFKVAFVGDTDYDANFEAVLSLIAAEGSDLVLHQGDFDYSGDPAGFFAKIDTALGADFPYLGIPGNHDVSGWPSDCGKTGGCYSGLFKDRMAANGIVPDDPDLDDEKYAVTYQGLKIVFVGQNGNIVEFNQFIIDQLEADDHTWKICSWHRNQKEMQVGGKSSQMGWDVYENCLNLGAIVATGHEHSYSRTRTLINAQNQLVDPECPLPDALCVGPGKSFVFVSGLGGRGIRNQDRCLPTTFPYGCNQEWASIYTSDQAAKYGALFITFNVDGDASKAHGYFKNIDGEVIDEFDVTNNAISGPVTQEISLELGWNMISSYVDPLDPSLEVMLAEIADKVVLIKNGAGQIYRPGSSNEIIDGWNVLEGYQIYMTAPATLSITGTSLLSESTPIVLEPGWHTIAYLQDSLMTSDLALATIAGKFLLIKNNAGEVYWPDFDAGSTIDMLPGQGYKIYMNDTATLIYPAQASLTRAVQAEGMFSRFSPIIFANQGGTAPPDCHLLTLTRTGQGTYPVVSPKKSPGCQDEHTYRQGHIVELDGAKADARWHIDGWVGTVDDSATTAANSVVMPSADHMAGVQYVADEDIACYDLTLTYTGQGSDPLATPPKSAVCTKDHSYEAGEKIQLSGAAPAANWFIAGWNGTDDDATTAATNTVTMPAANHTVEANYVQSCYTLTLSHTGQGSDPLATPEMSAVCTEKNKYVAGETITLSGAVPDPGWHIGGWSGTDDDAGTAAANTVTMPAADHAAAVNYAQSCYRLTVTHAGNGVTPVSAPEKSDACTEAGTYTAGETIQLSGAAPDPGWHIAGWSGTDADTSIASSNTVTMPAADHTATVIYEILGCYRLSLAHTGSGTDPTASPLMSEGCTQDNSYIEGQEVQLSGAVPDAGWFIDSWSNSDDDSSTSGSNKVTMPAQNRTVTVNYSGTCYNLVRDRTGQGSVPNASPSSSQGCSSGKYTAGELIELSNASPATGWHIAGWAGTNNNSSTADNNSVTMPASNHTAQINYLQSCYALTVGNTGQGSTPTADLANSAGCDAGTYHYQESIPLIGATPSADWYISGWTDSDNDGSQSGSNTVTMPANAHTARVDYAQICHALTLEKPDQGNTPTADPSNSDGCDSGFYHTGARIDLTAAPSTGWHIASWTGTDANSSTASTNTVTMPAAARTAGVIYEQSCYLLTIGKIGEGVTPTADSPSPLGCAAGTYHYQESIPLSGAVPESGWKIMGWEGTDDDGSPEPSNEVTMPAEPRTAKVIYELPCYKLTLEHTGQGSNPEPVPSKSAGCSSNGEYVENQVVALTATPNSGWYVDGWSNTDDDTSTETSNQVTIHAQDLTAGVDYAENQFPFTCISSGDHNDNVAVSNNTSGDITPASGDVIAAFTADGNLCSGKQLWNGAPIVTAWGDDGLTDEKDGMDAGEAMMWRVWDYSTNVVCAAIATYDPNFGDGTYHDSIGVHKITALTISCP